jgi:hypothetical protein
MDFQELLARGFPRPRSKGSEALSLEISHQCSPRVRMTRNIYLPSNSLPKLAKRTRFAAMGLPVACTQPLQPALSALALSSFDLWTCLLAKMPKILPHGNCRSTDFLEGLWAWQTI